MNENIHENIETKEIIKILCIGDPHIKVGNVPESEQMIEKLVQLATERKPNVIVVLGDILHRHETIHVSPLMRAEEMIRKLSEIAPTYLVVGNHDRPNNSNYLTNEHPFNAMKQWKNTYIADKVVDINFSGKRFLFVPYVPPGKFMDALNTIENPLLNTTAIFAHQEFFGAKMGAIISQAGDKWSLQNPLVVSGHIHDYDKLQDNIIYVGTPLQHAFGDRNDKTVSLFTFSDKNFGDDNEYNVGKNIHNYFNEERLDLGLIKRIIVYKTPEQIHTYEPPEDKLVKIVVVGDDAEIKAVSKLEKIKELKKKGVKVVFKAKNKENDNKEIKQKLRYKDRLCLEAEKNEGTKSWFNKLFS